MELDSEGDIEVDIESGIEPDLAAGVAAGSSEHARPPANASASRLVAGRVENGIKEALRVMLVIGPGGVSEGRCHAAGLFRPVEDFDFAA
ncbi:MAG TPA: hypothetical protein VNN80_00680 [Polyangiaceae bacterium]|jgi:hypothetical protein|nr:hypothetical protein [Polyangiaceae bacterium]